MTEFEEIKRPGVLNKNQMLELINHGAIKGWDHNNDEDDIGKSSLDLHIGDEYWKLTAGFKCRDKQDVSDLIEAAEKSSLEIRREKVPESGIMIDKGDTRLFKLQEKICLPDGFYGQGTGRSSIGRLDVLTRLLVDGEEKYDYICPGRERALYVEVTPLSFPIKIGRGYPVYQLRLCKGEFKQLLIPGHLVWLSSAPMCCENGGEIEESRWGHLRLDLTPTICKGIREEVIAFRARREMNALKPLDLEAEEGKYIPENYWEEITENSPMVTKIKDKAALRVEKEKFYILRSQERLVLPLNVAVYAIAMTEEVGELRIHHAGFVHPNFGRERTDDKHGTPLIFEVRGHDVNMLLMDGDLMAEIRYYPMSEKIVLEDKAEKTDGQIQSRDPYGEQELKLSKIFKDFGHAS